MIVTVALCFIMCWSPFYLVTLISQLQTDSFLRQANFVFTMLLTHLVGFTGSCINPIIYHMMSDRFRQGFRHIYCNVCCCRCLRQQGHSRRQTWDRSSRMDYTANDTANTQADGTNSLQSSPDNSNSRSLVASFCAGCGSKSRRQRSWKKRSRATWSSYISPQNSHRKTPQRGIEMTSQCNNLMTTQRSKSLMSQALMNKYPAVQSVPSQRCSVSLERRPNSAVASQGSLRMLSEASGTSAVNSHRRVVSHNNTPSTDLVAIGHPEEGISLWSQEMMTIWVFTNRFILAMSGIQRYILLNKPGINCQ